LIGAIANGTSENDHFITRACCKTKPEHSLFKNNRKINCVLL